MILSKDIYYNAEVWTLILHLLSLALLLLPLIRWLPAKYRRKSFTTERAAHRAFAIPDLLCGCTFLILLLLSASLILLPTNSFSINATTERIAGQIEGMERRSYIWEPSYTLNHQEYTGVYLRINGEDYYCAVGEELQVGDSVELLRTEGCDYVMRYNIVDSAQHNPAELSRTSWEQTAQYVLFATGIYLLLRSASLLFALRRKPEE